MMAALLGGGARRPIGSLRRLSQKHATETAGLMVSEIPAALGSVLSHLGLLQCEFVRDSEECRDLETHDAPSRLKDGWGSPEQLAARPRKIKWRGLIRPPTAVHSCMVKAKHHSVGNAAEMHGGKAKMAGQQLAECCSSHLQHYSMIQQATEVCAQRLF